MSTWIFCDGYFSERPHPGPFWISHEGGRIQEIRDEPPEEKLPLKQTDGPSYLAPLLSDTHAHVYMEPWPVAPEQRRRPGSKSLEEEIQDATKRLRSALLKGIGLVRDMGDPLGVNIAARRRVQENTANFPAFQIPGPAIHRPGKYGRYLGLARETLQDVHAMIDELAEQQGVDFIKIISTGIVDFGTRTVKQAPQFSGVELREIVRHAESLGLRVAAHCSGEEGIDHNILGGTHFIEHAYFIRQDQQRKLRDQGQYWTPTFAPVEQQATHPETTWDAPTRATIRRILSDHENAVAQVSDLRILAGTDAGSPGVEIGQGLLIEMNSLARSLPREEVLRIATATNADACRHRDYTGRIRPGDPASFAVYRKPPWKDFEELVRPVEVYHHGIELLKGESLLCTR
jgi:imidazolonepropionase-like amidohydrolase